MKAFLTLVLIAIALTVVLGLSGCASLQNAGSAHYSVKPYADEKGAVLCCAVDVQNGKEIANLEAHIVKNGDNYTIDLKEQGVSAFAGQAIAAQSAATASAVASKAVGTVGAILIAPVAAPAIGAVLGKVLAP